MLGSKDSTVLRALASYPCGPGSNPGVDAICWLSLFLILPFAPRGFFSGYSGFPLSSKTITSKFQCDQESDRQRTTLWMSYLQIIIYLFIYLLARCAVFNVWKCVAVEYIVSRRRVKSVYLGGVYIKGRKLESKLMRMSGQARD